MVSILLVKVVVCSEEANTVYSLAYSPLLDPDSYFRLLALVRSFRSFRPSILVLVGF